MSMLAPHLNTHIFSPEVEQVPNRDGFGNGLVAAAQHDERIVALCCDLTESTRMQAFAEKFPDRFVQMGIAEQSMASVASGMAAMGKIPFIASYAMFSPGRNWEQIRTTIAYNGTNVKIIGAHAGISVGPDGATHQAIEDVAIMRVIPNMVVLAPCDALEAEKATLAAALYDGPVYIRIAREKTPVITSARTPFAIGKSEVYLTREEKHEKKVGVIACGTIMHHALRAGKRLNEEGIGASVMNLATIKPLDTEGVLSFAQAHDLIVTVEEHQAAGGMGSAVAEYLAEKHPIRVLRIGVQDQFGQSGEPEELLRHYGLEGDSICRVVQEAVR